MTRHAVGFATPFATPLGSSVDRPMHVSYIGDSMVTQHIRNTHDQGFIMTKITPKTILKRHEEFRAKNATVDLAQFAPVNNSDPGLSAALAEKGPAELAARAADQLLLAALPDMTISAAMVAPNLQNAAQVAAVIASGMAMDAVDLVVKPFDATVSAVAAAAKGVNALLE